MSFLHDLAADDGFWTTVIGTDSALIIAVVVEGRSVRRQLDEEEEALSKENEESVRKALEGDSAEMLGSLMRPWASSPLQIKRLARIRDLLSMLGLLALSIVIAFVFLLPLDYSSDFLVAVGVLVGLGGLAFGLFGLVFSAVRVLTRGA